MGCRKEGKDAMKSAPIEASLGVFLELIDLPACLV